MRIENHLIQKRVKLYLLDDEIPQYYKELVKLVPKFVPVNKTIPACMDIKPRLKQHR